ncbi:MAG: Flp family type IVb pilin [Ruminiclostridium sp.]|nr:Flp family type IVb pilin [Ruminiclostridium sp.]
MMKMYVKCMMVLNSFKESKKGQGMVEYGLIVGLIAIAVIAAITLLGGNIRDLFNNVAGTLGAAVPTAVPT